MRIAKEILVAWFGAPYSEDDWNRRQIARIQELEAFYGQQKQAR